MVSPPGERAPRRSGPTVATPASESVDSITGFAPRSWPLSYRRLWIGSVLLVVFAFVWIRMSVGGPQTTELFTDSLVAIAATAAALALTTLGWRDTDHPTRGWRVLAIGAWLEALGEISWVAYTVLAGEVPYPGLPDVFYFLGYPFLAAGFLLLAHNPDQPRQMVRLGLDGLVVGAALLMLGWHFVLEAILAVSTLDALTTWLSLGYPIADILVGAIAFVIAMNTRGPRRVPLLLVAAGILAWSFGDSAFAYLEFTGGYTSTELSLSWLVGDLAIALGALHPNATTAPTSSNRSHYEFHELISPYAPFLVAMTLMGYQGISGNVDAYDFVFAGIVILALFARQAYVLSDATSLSRDLERNEHALARRNQELLLINRIVRHDIRNDMAVAHGWAGELESHVDREGEQMLERVLTTTQHTIDLTENLRDFVAALEPTQDATFEPVPLDETLEATLASRRETYPNATFTADEIPAVDVTANALLDTVFRNLLNNAVQHNDDPHPVVEVDVQTTPDTVQIRIADNGPGVPVDRRDAVFGRDERGVDSPGTGVGLYLVDTLVTHYGGRVWIEDNDPRGAVFVVELKRA